MRHDSKVLDELLIWGLDDWAMAADVAFLVKELMGIEDQDARREPAIEVIRQAVEGGFMRLGDLLDEGRFTPWDLDDASGLERVRTEWEALGRPVTIYEVCWLENTELGNERARKLLDREDQTNSNDRST